MSLESFCSADSKERKELTGLARQLSHESQEIMQEMMAMKQDEHMIVLNALLAVKEAYEEGAVSLEEKGSLKSHLLAGEVVEETLLRKLDGVKQTIVMKCVQRSLDIQEEIFTSKKEAFRGLLTTSRFWKSSGESSPRKAAIAALPIVKTCAHYDNNVRIFASCCGKFYDCHLCHNEEHADGAEPHIVDRVAIKRVQCVNCGMTASPSSECRSCGITFAKYHCSLCKIWVSDDREAFHCHKCRSCKLGKKDDFYHCDACALCFAKSTRSRHECSKKIDKTANCPICLDRIFGLRNGVIMLKCRHLVHKECLDLQIKSCPRDKIPSCSLCKKSVVVYQSYTERFDRYVQDYPMPDYYAHWTSNILCNDCQASSTARYHSKYHKCRLCGSYNTSIKHINKRDSGGGDGLI